MTPIAQAVEPLRQAAIDKSAVFASKLIDQMMARLEAHGWNIKAAYPRPTGTMDKFSYRLAQVQLQIAERLTTLDKTKHPFGTMRMGEPHYVVPNQLGAEKFIEEARADASAQYDLFIAKLEQKVGEHSAARLDGDHVWGFSILSVTTPNGVQRWKTQQIVNTSSLGKVFNQWPTRLLIK